MHTFVCICAYICAKSVFISSAKKEIRDSCGKLLVIRWYIICAPPASQSVLYMHMIHPLDYHNQYRYIGTAAGKARKEEFCLAPQFRAWNFDHKMLATGRLTKKSFDVTPEILATQFWQQKKTPAAVAVAPQMSNVFWYPRSFVPNKFALDPVFYALLQN